jgi:hypothetical protein
MARARMYGWNGETPAKPVSGQKQIVLFTLSLRPDEMHTGHEWTEIVMANGGVATKQDPYRVVLYYLLELKKEGCVKTAEKPIEAVTVSDGSAHKATVTTVSEVTAVPLLASSDEDYEDDEVEEEEDEDFEDEDDEDEDFENDNA